MKNVKFVAVLLVVIGLVGAAAWHFRWFEHASASKAKRNAPSQQLSTGRADIDKPVRLEEAVAAFNQAYPGDAPLTVEEVVAAVRNIKAIHPDIHPWFYQQYQMVADQKMLPPGFDFVQRTSFQGHSVDWKDLIFTPQSPHARLASAFSRLDGDDLAIVHTMKTNMLHSGFKRQRGFFLRCRIALSENQHEPGN